MTCPVCYEEGGLRDACAYPSAPHVECLAVMLQHNFTKCPFGFAKFTELVRPRLPICLSDECYGREQA